MKANNVITKAILIIVVTFYSLSPLTIVYAESYNPFCCNGGGGSGTGSISTTTVIGMINTNTITTLTALMAAITTATIIGLTTTNATFTNASSTNFFSNFLTAITGVFTNLTSTNFIALGNSTLATTTISALKDSSGSLGLNGQVLVTTGTTTKWVTFNAQTFQRTTSVNTTLNPLTDRTLFVDASTTLVTVTLPPATGIENTIFDIKKISNTGFTVRVVSSSTIDGSNMFTFPSATSRSSFRFYSDNVNWWLQ